MQAGKAANESSEAKMALKQRQHSGKETGTWFSPGG